MTKNVYETETLKSLGKMNPDEMVLSNVFNAKLFDEENELLEKLSDSILAVSFMEIVEVPNDPTTDPTTVQVIFKSTAFAYLMLKKLRHGAFSLSSLQVERYVESRFVNNKGATTDKVISNDLMTYKMKIDSIADNSIVDVDLRKDRFGCSIDGEDLCLLLECTLEDVK